MAGSHALYRDSELCIVIGFSEIVFAENDLKTLNKEQINEFKSTIYCTNPLK